MNGTRQVVEAAREVLGGIDLDPASSELANETVKARQFYTEQDDGLSESKRWRGRVWMNPPYGGQAEGFVNKLLEEYEAGNVSAAIALLNSRSMATRWFQPLRVYPLCMLERLPFHNPYRKDRGSGVSPTSDNGPVVKGTWRGECNQFSAGDEDACTLSELRT